MTKRQLRKKTFSDEEPSLPETENLDSESAPTKLDVKEALELRKMKKKRSGVEASALLHNADPLSGESHSASETWMLKTGRRAETDQVKKTNVAAHFEAESKTMDTEKLMHKFIESQMRKDAQEDNETENALGGESVPISVKLKEELFAFAPAVKKGKEDQTFITPSAELLVSVPEVDLGIEIKLKNIEATEMARKKAELNGRQVAKPDDDLFTNHRFDMRYENRMGSKKRATDDLVFGSFKKRAQSRMK